MTIWDWSKKFSWNQELSAEEVRDLVSYIMEYGHTVYTNHAYEQMECRNFTEQDVSNILETGQLVSQEFDESMRNWKYKLQGETIDDGSAIVVTAVVNHRRQLIVTVF